VPELARRGSRVVLGLGELPRAFDERRDDPEGTVDSAAEALASATSRGREEGVEEGRRLAHDEASNTIAQMRAELTRALERIAELESELNRRHREKMIELALEAASKIVRARIDAADPIAARALREAVDAMPSGSIRARLHPDDLEVARDELRELIEREQIELAPDPKVGRGGCVVESRAGVIHATTEIAQDAVYAAAVGREDGP
jgi:flagellar assembly protein FliH